MRQNTKRLRRGLFRLVLLSLLLALVLTGTNLGVAQADPGWYNASWAYRKKITIDNTKVTANLTNFPVLISLPSDDDLKNDAQNNGDDILFTAADETTKLSHEIEEFDGGTGKLVAWVKVPSLSSTVDTDIYMYYGNGGASNQEDVTNVWDSSYKMVQHLHETAKTAGTYNDLLDSTSNNNDGEAENGVTMNATGKINGADSFDGSDDYGDYGDKSDFDFTTGEDFTIGIWIKTSVAGVRKGIVGKRSSGGGWVGYELEVTDSNIVRGRIRKTGGADVDTVSSSNVTDGSWHHIVFVADRDANGQIYIDGSTDGSPVDISSQNGDLSNSDSFWVARDDAAGYFNGIIDEVRISSTARSADWIATEYNNQSSPSGFYSVGTEETSGAPIEVGGQIFPINKARVVAQWLILMFMLSLAIGGGALLIGRYAVSQVGNKER